jgi:DHA1 family multidrug resistance protein-like MFS transporter
VSQNRKNLWILFFTLVVMMLGFGIIIPIMPFYVTSLGATGSTLGLLMATFSVTQFIFAPIWGSLSDRVGRKPIIVLGILGNILSQVMMGFATQLWMLFVARALSGILSSATMPTAMAYAGDSTAAKDRPAAMGMLGAAMSMGMVLGPGIGGLLAGSSLATPFFVAGGLSSVALLLVMLILPESLPIERRVHATHVRGPQLATMWHALRGPMGFLLFLAFLLSFGLTNFEGVFGLYTLRRFNYGPTEVGSVMMIIGIVSAITQGVLTGMTTRRWGELAVIRAALLCTGIGFIVMLTANSFPTVLLTVAFFVLSNGMIGPSVASLISKQASSGQGMSMGLNNAFMSLGRIVGPILAGALLDANLSLPYLFGGLVFLVCFLLSVFKLRPMLAPAAGRHTPEALHGKPAPVGE